MNDVERAGEAVRLKLIADSGSAGVGKPRVFKHGRKWQCVCDGTYWQFDGWWAAVKCALTLSRFETPSTVPIHTLRRSA